LLDEQTPPTPGQTIVARASRSRLPAPLQGTATARRLRHARHWLAATAFARRHNAALPADAPLLRFYPGRPQPRAQIRSVVERLGLRIAFAPDGRAPGVTLAWDSGSWFDPRAARRLPPDALNARCLDVSKSTVDRLWQQVAGYGVTVDPLTTSGPIVVKSELNGTHDGELLMGPLPARRAGHVYQRLIDGRRDGRVYATRAIIVGRGIALGLEKWRPYPNWFHGGSVVTPAEPAELWSADEMALIMRLCAAIGLDYGEVDVLREAATGLIYVIDVNRTPIRPIGLGPEHDERVYSTLAAAFAELYAERSSSGAARSAR
jgi:hypothetical protein